MEHILRTLATLPIPLILVLGIGILVWRRRILSRVLITAATLVLLALSLPMTGRLLEAPLINAAPVLDSVEDLGAAVILVPTGGIFADSTGVWWPSSASIVRAVAAVELRAATGSPLLLIGGSPRGEADSEALVVARAVGLVGPDDAPRDGIILETAARNSAETAAAARPILDRLGADRVILVTSPTHVARMAASLRHLGYPVSIHVARGKRAPIQPLGALEPFVPSAGGLSRSARAVHEYLGLLWYLLNGQLTVADIDGRAVGEVK